MGEKLNYVNMEDLQARLQVEFPGEATDIKLRHLSADKLRGNLFVPSDKPQVEKRALELVEKMKLFNAHVEHGHRKRKTKWWDT
jgi:hypothetical protein